MSKRVVVNGVYKGYVPARLPQHKPRNPIKPWFKVIGKPTVSIFPKPVKPEWTETPQYPALYDGSRAARKWKARVDWYDSLKNIALADKKMREIITDLRHITALFKDGIPAYNSLPLAQYLTKTNLIKQLPNDYITSSKDTATDAFDPTLVERVRNSILDEIRLIRYQTLQNFNVNMTATPEDKAEILKRTDQRTQQIIFAAKKALPSSPLHEMQLDLSPSIHSWWWHSGFEPPNKDEWFETRKDDDGNINQLVQYSSSSALHFRSNNLLSPFLSKNDESVTNIKLVPEHRVPLANYGAEIEKVRPIMLPGFWNEKVPEYDCPHTCVMTLDYVQNRHSQITVKQMDDVENCLDSKAIMTAFSWLNSLSAHHGFTPYQEIEYPFTCQLITTDGQDWVFHVYQLNSHAFHRDLKKRVKAVNNVCWSSGKMRLFERYEDGKFKKIDDDVIRLLIKFLMQRPNKDFTEQINLRPYLGVDDRSELDRYCDFKWMARMYANNVNTWLEYNTKVPLWEELFFNLPETKHAITHIKPMFKFPLPPLPDGKFE